MNEARKRLRRLIDKAAKRGLFVGDLHLARILILLRESTDDELRSITAEVRKALDAGTKIRVRS